MAKRNLGDLLSKNEAASSAPGKSVRRTYKIKPILRFYTLSGLELGTKLNDKEALANLGELVRNDKKKVDFIMINGGLAHVPDKYSRLRGERLDLLEDHLLERYGQDVYDKVKTGKNESDSVDDLGEATRLANILMGPLANAAYERKIEIGYVGADTDYKNVKMVIETLEKLSKHNRNGHNSKKRSKKKSSAVPDEVERILSIIPEGYTFKASKWKSSDKDGIKNRANEIYHHLLQTIFRDDEGNSPKVHIYKRFENYVGDEDQKPEDVTVNGVKIKVFHAINGLTTGLNEAKPSDRNIKLTLDYAKQDAIDGRLGDVYLTGSAPSTEYTLVNFKSREDPILIFNQGPLMDIDRQFKLRASFNKTKLAKELSQFTDSGVSIVTINSDGSYDIEHLGITALKKKVNPSKLEMELSKGSMYEMTQIGDWHVGNAKADYEAMERVPEIMKRSRVPREYRKLDNMGDMADGGNDKAQRTRMSFPTAPTPEHLNKALEELSKEPDYTKRIRRFKNLIYESIYGHSDIDLGRQVDRLDTYVTPLAALVSTVYASNGNHWEKATGNGSEVGGTKKLYSRNGEVEVIDVDELQNNEQNAMLGDNVLFLKHSPGFRGGIDARTALMNKVKDIGENQVDIVGAGDCHEMGAKYAFKRKRISVDGEEKYEWRTLVAFTSGSLEKRTNFEKDIINKIDYTKGFSQMYIPTDDSIGTSYILHRLIPSQTIHREIDAAGGPRLYKNIDKILEK